MVSLCLLYSMVSSCVIIGSLGVIILGGVTITGTLSGGTVSGNLTDEIVGTSLGNNLVWVFSGCMMLNICANLSMAYNWLSLIVKGVCGPGFLIICSSYLAALVACSAADNSGMMRCCGKITPHLHVFPPWCWVCSMCSIGSAS